MKIKHVFLILAMTLVNVGLANAIEPIPSDEQVVKSKPIAEDEIQVVVEPSTDKVEDQVEVPNFLDTCYYDSGSLNLSFQFIEQPDSIDFSVIEHYIKQVMLVKQNVDSKKNDLLEIL